MKSKEALEILIYFASGTGNKEKNIYYKTIKQDLENLDKLIQENNSLRAFVGNLQTCREREASKIEELEKENQVLLVNKNVAQGIAKKFKEENDKLKKAIKIMKENLDKISLDNPYYTIDTQAIEVEINDILENIKEVLEKND